VSKKLAESVTRGNRQGGRKYSGEERQKLGESSKRCRKKGGKAKKRKKMLGCWGGNGNWRARGGAEKVDRETPHPKTRQAGPAKKKGGRR